MQLFTEVPIPKPNFDINYQDGVFCLGSCFVNEIGQKLTDAKFHTCINPFGTQFHPLAMEQVMSRIFSRSYYTENEIFHFRELYFSWDHSNLYSTPRLKSTLATVNETIENGNDFLSKANVFIFTLGTAWAYLLKDAQFYVSNCHKVPQKHFEKHLLKRNQVLASLRNLVLMVKDIQPKSKIIFTISPIRHTRDGYRENHVSKGLLHNALHHLLKEFKEVEYFPSYEIVMDELRDYRYFKEDLVHLNDLGIQYVWEKFSQNYFLESTFKTLDEVKKIRMALEHRPTNPKSMNHRKFLYDTRKKAEILALKLPKNSLNKEIQELKNKIHAY